MKVLLKVLITIIFLVSTLLGMAFVSGNSDNAESMRQNEAAMQAASAIAKMFGAGEALGDIPTEADYKNALYIDFFFMVICVFGIVFAFVRSKMGGLIVAGLIGISAILLYVMQPVLNGTEFQNANSDKTFALVVMLIALAGVGLLVLLKTQFSNKAVQPLPTEFS